MKGAERLTSWPLGLGSSDQFTMGNNFYLIRGTVEVLAILINSIGLCGLEVRKGIVPKPIYRACDTTMLRENPCSPSVYMANGLILNRCTSNLTVRYLM